MSILTRSSKVMTEMPTVSRRHVLGLLAGTGMIVALPRLAKADPLDGPRNAGTVGERFDGYAETRDGASGDDQSLVQSINDQRRAFYQQKAAEEGVDISEIQRIYAKVIYDKAPSGWWFLTQSGWKQK